jgi:polyisoprenyl-phosphate glycosyltransferase
VPNEYSAGGTSCKILISIIVPTHNEAANIPELYDRIAAAMATRQAYDFELIFCDDSTDETPIVIAACARRDPRVKLIRFPRRFGQAVAIAAGLEHCSGGAAIMMDADLQDPPEVIPQLLAEWERGNKLVYVERKSSSQSKLYFVGAQVFYRLLNKLSDPPIPRDAGEFRLMDRHLIDFMIGLKEHSRFIRGLTVWPGFPSAKVKIERAERKRGKTNYNIRKAVLNAVDGIISFSVKPLRVAVFLGLLMSALSAVGVLYAVVLRLFTPYWAPGWTLLFSSLLLISGMQFICIGILGEYVGRIFTEVQNRPLYIIDYTLGLESRTEHGASAQPTEIALRKSSDRESKPGTASAEPLS